ncbi:VOC family protein [Alteribacter aurantiacus]|uniref:VOC family protein n=1 Tax=Alteribacter aurantiacus TaxID=254410 RepID=UPI00041E6042|nr:VOC family protein [Alteribacter aurantiacus]
MKLDNIRLLVSHFEDCFYFYRDTLQLAVTWGEAGGAYASFQDEDENTIGLFKKELMAEAVNKDDLPPDVQDRFAFIFRVDNLEETVATLKEKGAHVTDIKEQSGWGIKTAYIRDPDGNLIELMESIPRDTWDKSLKEEDAKYSQ